MRQYRVQRLSGALDLKQLADIVNRNLDAIALSLTNAGGALADGDYGDVTVSSGGTVISIDADTIGQDELATSGTPDGTKFLRDDMSWQSVSWSGMTHPQVLARTMGS